MRTCGKGWHLSLLHGEGPDLEAESILWNPKVVTIHTHASF